LDDVRMERSPVLDEQPAPQPSEEPKRFPPDEVRVLQPRQAGPVARLRELWEHRRLIPYFGHRLFIYRLYRRTILGKAWIVLRPVLQVGGTVLLFGAVLEVPSDGIPYIIFLLVGTSCWQLFSGGVYWAARSGGMLAGLMGRLYVPRLTILVSSTAIELVQFAVYAAMTILVMAYYGITEGDTYLEIGPQTLLAVAGLVMALLLVWTFGLFLSVLAAQARDVRLLLKEALRFWMYATPVVYPLSIVPHPYHTFVELNPVTAPVELFKAGLLGTGDPTGLSLAASLGAILVVGAAGLVFFGASESAAVDSI
jgi:lipopolysaccharide transport system permease protein